MVKSSLISTTNPQTPNKPPIQKPPPQKLYKIHPLDSNVEYTIIMDKNLKTCLKELHTTLNQRVYLMALINKGFELAEKIP